MSDTQHQYMLDGVAVKISPGHADTAQTGPDVVLSRPGTGITDAQPWYEDGFTVAPVFDEATFAALRDGIEDAIRTIMANEGAPMGDGGLSQYHRYVDDAAHMRIVGRTRDLFQSDFALDIDALHARLGEVLGFRLSDRDPVTGMQMHIILRINRPGSDDFNPVHKDIYEGVDHLGKIPAIVNIWIPICGVGPDSALPVAPRSHLLNENTILRTRAGSIVQGKKYHVNSILNWDGHTALERAVVPDGAALIFSSHLIHGLALNQQPDTTRIALEFRLGRAE